MTLYLQRTGAVERLLHRARRRALRLAAAAVLGLPVPLLAQSPHPTEPSTTLLPPRPMPGGQSAAKPVAPAETAPRSPVRLPEGRPTARPLPPPPTAPTLAPPT